MKNLILLVTFFFIQQAFAIENIRVSFYGNGSLFTEKFNIAYCADVKCNKAINPSQRVKKEFSTTELIFNKIANNFKIDFNKSTNASEGWIDTWDLNTDVSKEDLIELMQEDFSGDNGDEPMHFLAIKKVLSIIAKYDAKFSILGMMSNNYGEMEMLEFILIYIPQLDKVYSLERKLSVQY